MKILLHTGKSSNKVKARQTTVSCSKFFFVGLRVAAIPKNFAILTFTKVWIEYNQHVGWHNFGSKYEHFFILKTGDCPQRLSSNPERLSSQSVKIWSQGYFKNPKFPTL